MTETIKFNFLTKLNEEDLELLKKELNSLTREKEEDKVRTVVNEHTTLVGKCFKTRVQPHSKLFPEMWRYYKIISERASDQYRISALRFDEYPTYWFKYKSSKGWNIGNYFFGCYEFNSIVIEDFPYFCFDWKTKSALKAENDLKIVPLKVKDNLKEISLNEYNEAMNKYIERLQEMSWPADHYRFGNKLPTDEGWERKDE